MRTLRVSSERLSEDAGVASGGSDGAGAGGSATLPRFDAQSPSEGGALVDGNLAPPTGDAGCLHVGADGKPDCSDTLMQNADFNHDVTGWTESDAFGNTKWNSQDSQGRNGSGSMAVTNTYQASEDNAFVGAAAQQCIAVTPGKTYTFSAQAFIASGQPAAYGNAAIAAWFYTGTDCGGQVPENGAYIVGSADKLDTWVPIPGAGFPGGLIAPAIAKSMAVRLVAQKPGNLGSFEAMFDAVRVTAQN